MPEVNILAVIAAALGTFVLGGLWYSPALFGKAWQREAGVTDERMRTSNKTLIFGLTFVLSLVAWYVIKMIFGMRVSAEDEARGLDISEMGMEAYAGDPMGK